jgi:DNA mismatch repair protein MutL
MNKIKVLPKEEALKIAAGEVVERPASVVKELVENSIDAQATQISLYVEEAGKKLLRIVDNGCGMSKEDARLCFVKHATSKINSLSDLTSIVSFGFRGEALASISAISNVTLITKNEESDLGIQIDFPDGEKEVAAPIGTDISIQNLFYNTPARRKFSKHDETEWNAIQTMLHAFCLSNLRLHFKLYRDTRMIFNAPPAQTIKDRASQLWSHNFSTNLLELPPQAGSFKNKYKPLISGYISNHSFWRYGRQQIFFFVNNRWVKNPKLSSALLKGYRGALPPGRLPAGFIFLSIAKDLVDINVHPRKEEVQFIKPTLAATTLQELVTRTLEDQVNSQLEETSSIQSSSFHTTHPTLPQDAPFFSTDAPQQSPDELPVPEREISSFPIPDPWENIIPQQQSASIIQPTVQKKIETVREERPLKIIGQLLKTYILIENQKGLLIIDQHAAHERILYEKYLKNFEQKDGIQLLFPEIIQLKYYEIDLILKEKAFFLRQGFEIEQCGKSEIAVKTAPPKLQHSSIKELVFEAISFLEENDNLDEEAFRKKLNEHVHSHMACKMAIKAGDELDHTMMQNIVQELMEVNNRFICVHGRPTMWTVEQGELEKKFRRT